MLRIESPRPLPRAVLTVTTGAIVGIACGIVLASATGGGTDDVVSTEAATQNDGPPVFQTVPTTNFDGDCPNPGVYFRIGYLGVNMQRFIAVRYVDGKRQLRACIAEDGFAQCSPWDTCEHARHRTDSDIAAYCQYHNECGPWLVRDSYEVGSSVVQFRSRGCWPEAEYELVRFSHDSVVGVAVGGSVQEDQAPSATAHVFPGYVRFESTSGGDVLVNLEHGVVAPVLAVPAQEPFGCRGTFECGARQVTCLDEVPWSERVTRRVGDKAFGRKMGAGMMQLMAANERAERGEVFVPLPKDE